MTASSPDALVLMTVVCAWCRAKSAHTARPIEYPSHTTWVAWPACVQHSEAETCPVCESAPAGCACSRMQLFEHLQSLTRRVGTW